ncbi:MAG: hemerythrin domain-containing protein [Acidimicrobiia bacterium]|nr:hemerythrin domain-containing protein [Acidimicrobiia bacterium]
MTIQQHNDASQKQEADLRRFHLAHLALRTHADDICRALAALKPGESEKAAAIGRLWMIYEAAARGHDVAESALCWPVVTERDPSFAEIQNDMDKQHQVVDEQARAASAALNRLAEDPSRARIADAVETMSVLRQGIEDHFIDEEDRALPRLAATFTNEDLDALERRRRRMPKEMRVMFIAAEDGAARRANARDLSAALPLGDRIQLALFWRRHYRRIVGPVLAIK